MRILFVAARFPLPAHTGAKIRTFHLLRAAALKHEVVFVAPVSLAAERAARDTLAAMLPGVTVRTDDRPDLRRTPVRLALSAMRNLVQPLPLTWIPYQALSLASLLHREMSMGTFDLVHCDHVHAAPVVVRGAACPLVVDAHNVESLMATRLWQTEAMMHRRVPLRWQARKIERAERALYPRFDACLACSDHDAALLRELAPATEIRTIPNGVDLEYFRPLSTRGEQAPTLVFTGSLDWGPNQDAARYFVRHIWPLIRADWPTATCAIVGRNPSRSVMALEGPGLTVRGNVDDIRPILGAATAVIVPLRAGSGTRLKILEAWAMEKAVVSTTLGAEGLAVSHAKNILLADSAQEFASAVGQLLRDRALRTRLAAAGRSTAEQFYSWDGIGRRLLAVYEDVALARDFR